MNRRASRGLAVLLCVSVGGCGTIVGLPEPMGGVTTHGQLLGLADMPSGRRDAALAPFWFALLPFTLPDLVLSFAADVVLLPVLAPYAFSRERARPEPRRQPPPVRRVTPAPAPPRARTTAPASPPSLVLAAGPAASDSVGGPPDPTRMSWGRGERPRPVVREDDPFVWLPDGGAVDPRQVRELEDRARALRGTVSGLVVEAHLAEREGDPSRAIALCERGLEVAPERATLRLVQGWAFLRLGRLDEAQRELRVAFTSCVDPLDRTFALIGLGRLAEAQGEREEAARRYRRALDDGALGGTRAWTGAHVADLRRRLADLDAR